MNLTIAIELPEDLARFRLPPALEDRLQSLLDKQESGTALTPAEAGEAEGLVGLAVPGFHPGLPCAVPSGPGKSVGVSGLKDDRETDL